MTESGLQDQQGADSISPVKPKSAAKKPSQSSKPVPSKKRASPEADNNAAKKRRVTQPSLSSEEALSSPPSQFSEEENEQTTATKPKTKKVTSKSAPPAKTAKSRKGHETVAKTSKSESLEAPAESAKAEKVEASDSELSVLIDDEPKPKKKRKGSATGPEKRGRKPSASKTKADADLDPHQAEIKRLQGWLVKCGIRKLWGKELKPYESPSAKIKHLKQMLADAGMTGRYSLERANQIKEKRELKADIEAVQEGAERWGKNQREAEEDGRTKPKKRLVRGAQVLDFLSSDGEETD